MSALSTDLVKYAAIVWIESALEKKEPFLYYTFSAPALSLARAARDSSFSIDVHLLKLLTGVEISTRAVNISGSPGKVRTSNTRRRAAVVNSKVLGCAR